MASGNKISFLWVNVVRLSVGAFFIFSGLTKLNDPMGFGFKLEEYFSADVLNMPFFEPYSLPFAVAVIVVEIVLGVMLILGSYQKLTLWLLLLLDVFFSFLTFYSAYFEKVTGCGCFGDVIPLAPWSSFTKDIVLLALILFMLWGRRHIGPLFSQRTNLTILSGSVLAVLAFAFYTLTHLPVIDFRPYKVGVNIPEAMSIPQDAPRPQIEITWQYRVNGEVKNFTDDDQPWNIEAAEYVGQQTKILHPGYTPPITDFSIESDDAGDITDSILHMPDIYLIIAPYLEQSSQKGWEKVRQWKQTLPEGTPVAILSGTSTQETGQWEQTTGGNIPVYFTDPITLKTILRSYPGVVHLKNGTIVSKSNFREL